MISLDDKVHLISFIDIKQDWYVKLWQLKCHSAVEKASFPKCQTEWTLRDMKQKWCKTWNLFLPMQTERVRFTKRTSTIHEIQPAATIIRIAFISSEQKPICWVSLFETQQKFVFADFVYLTCCLPLSGSLGAALVSADGKHVNQPVLRHRKRSPHVIHGDRSSVCVCVFLPVESLRCAELWAVSRETIDRFCWFDCCKFKCRLWCRVRGLPIVEIIDVHFFELLGKEEMRRFQFSEIQFCFPIWNLSKSI